MKNKDLSLRVQKYLGGELTAVEAESFKAEVAKNNELKKELELQQGIANAIMDDTPAEFLSRLNKIHNELGYSKSGPKIFSLKKVTLLAASFLVLISLGSVFVFNAFNTPSHTELFEEYYEPYDLSITTRSVVQNEISSFDKAVIKYNNGEYIETKTILKEIMVADNPNGSILIMLGISCLELNELDQAKSYFTQLVESDNAFFTQQAKWYLALCYLKEKNLTEAVAALEHIASDTGYYKTKAHQLLGGLKNN
ncbi:MAG: hypothetical protein CL663_03120 [Bacteroidetes bacterium]|nr:hypothetical protein [Bacteroidota bacterium]